MILDIRLHTLYTQDISGAGGECQNLKIFADVICTIFFLLSRRRINLCLFDLRDDRSVRSALFFVFLVILHFILVRVPAYYFHSNA